MTPNLRQKTAKPSRLKVKVLQLPSSLRLGEYDDDSLVPYAPIFNRPGWYYSNGVSWYEVPGGKAFKASVASFALSIETLDASMYNEKQINALKECIKQGVASRQQKKLVDRWNHWRWLIDIKR